VPDAWLRQPPVPKALGAVFRFISILLFAFPLLASADRPAPCTIDLESEFVVRSRSCSDDRCYLVLGVPVQVNGSELISIGLLNGSRQHPSLEAELSTSDQQDGYVVISVYFSPKKLNELSIVAAYGVKDVCAQFMAYVDA